MSPLLKPPCHNDLLKARNLHLLEYSRSSSPLKMTVPLSLKPEEGQNFQK